MPRLLLVDTDPVLLQGSAEYLERKGCQVVSARGSTKARELLQKDLFSATAMDDRLDWGDGFTSLLRAIQEGMLRRNRKNKHP